MAGSICYNVETAIDSKNKLAIDYDVINIASDRNQLSPMAKSAKEILEVERIDATADKGFHDSVDIQECVDNGITPYVPEPVIMGKKPDEDSHLTDGARVRSLQGGL